MSKFLPRRGPLASVGNHAGVPFPLINVAPLSGVRANGFIMSSRVYRSLHGTIFKRTFIDLPGALSRSCAQHVQIGAAYQWFDSLSLARMPNPVRQPTTRAQVHVGPTGSQEANPSRVAPFLGIGVGAAKPSSTMMFRGECAYWFSPSNYPS